MSTIARPRKPWDTRAYHRIVSVSHGAGGLAVEFEDGARVQVDPRQILPPDTPPVLWDRLTHSPYEIIIPNELDHDVVPWDVIRSLTDPMFEAHLAAAAAEQAAWIGHRIEELRHARGLTIADVAERTNISPATLSQVERGEHEVRLPLLERVLAAVGGTFDDLVREREDRGLVATEQAS